MDSKEFCHLLKENGYNFFSGVPCSLFKGIIAELENDLDVPYLPAVREDAALGVAAGAYLAGKQPVVLMQNSGIGHTKDFWKKSRQASRDRLKRTQGLRPLIKQITVEGGCLRYRLPCSA